MSKLLTLRETADRLRLSEWTVRRMVKDGRLQPCPLTPGKLLFTEAAVEQVIRQAQQPEPSQTA
jgi:excisionase family DNA binding protein